MYAKIAKMAVAKKMSSRTPNYNSSGKTQIPGWAKGVAVIAVLGGIAFIVFKINKYAKDKKTAEANIKEGKEVENELKIANSNPATKQTLAPSQAAGIANAIWTAMDGYGTDGPAIFSKLQSVKNQADWLALRAAYGPNREVSSGKFNPEPNFKGPLEAALASELGINDIAWINKINAYFAKQGVKVKL